MSHNESTDTDWSLYRLQEHSTYETHRQQNASPEAIKHKKSKRSREFFAGPIDMEWLCEVGKLKGAALQVAIMISHIGKMRNLVWIPLSNHAMARIGVSADAKSRALISLEKAGLIEVKRQIGKSPRVKVLCKMNAEELSG